MDNVLPTAAHFLRVRQMHSQWITELATNALMAQISRNFNGANYKPIMDTIQTAIHPPSPIMDTIISTLMAQTSRPPTSSVSVVSPNFVAPNPLKLTMLRDWWLPGNGNFSIADEKGNVMLKVKQKYLSPFNRRVLLDASGTPILSIQQKLLSPYKRWVVFRGDSSDTKDIIFSAKRSSLFQPKTTLDVFLGCNRNEQICDFKLKGSWCRRSGTIYAAAGDHTTNTILAQMHKKFTLQSLAPGRDTFSVITVNPNVDYAFIVVILHEINEEQFLAESKKRSGYFEV